ncbi:cupin domain-containing protein [Nocardia sp. NPDC057227]|uniref:cupin domain-containing protein n=1 Tax=Nocardia sp. NPDC057227 TaxID=3346056 RepID=UPI00362E4720
MRIGGLVSGECWLLVEGREPVPLREGDTFMLGNPPPYVLASAPDVPPRKAGPDTGFVRIGPESEEELYLCTGHIAFDDANAALRAAQGCPAGSRSTHQRNRSRPAECVAGCRASETCADYSAGGGFSVAGNRSLCPLACRGLITVGGRYEGLHTPTPHELPRREIGMDDQNTKQYTVREVVHDVVADVAPEELPVLAGLGRLDDDTALRRLTRRRQPREPLGFGLDTVEILATAIAWVAVEESVRHMVQPAADGLSRGVGARLRRLFGRRSAPTVVPALTPEQLSEVHRRVLELSEQNGFDPDRAAVLAERVTARLALGTPDTDESASGDGSTQR